MAVGARCHEERYGARMSGNSRPRARSLPIPLLDPFCAWQDGAETSHAERDGLRLVVERLPAGRWVFEVYAQGSAVPLQAGGVRGWTREQAKAAAVSKAARLLARRKREAGAASPGAGSQP